MPAKPAKKSLLKALPGPGAAQKKPVTTGLMVEGAEQERLDLTKGKRNQVVIPPREVFETYKLGPDGQDVYDFIQNWRQDEGLTTGIFILIGRKVRHVEYIADYQSMVRDLLHGTFYGLIQRRITTLGDIVRHILAGLLFYAPQEIVPLPMAAQIVAQEALYTRWNPRIGENFSMRMMSYSLAQSVIILHVNGSVGSPHYTHSEANMEAVLRGYSEGMKTAGLLVSGNSFNHAMANVQMFNRGIEEGYQGLKKEIQTRVVVSVVDQAVATVKKWFGR